MPERSDPPDFEHRPVMVAEVVDALQGAPPGTVLDATVGGGGHAEAILEARPDLSVVGLDLDDEPSPRPNGDWPDSVIGPPSTGPISPISEAALTAGRWKAYPDSSSTSACPRPNWTVPSGVSVIATRGRSTCEWTAAKRSPRPRWSTGLRSGN